LRERDEAQFSISGLHELKRLGDVGTLDELRLKCVVDLERLHRLYGGRTIRRCNRIADRQFREASGLERLLALNEVWYLAPQHELADGVGEAALTATCCRAGLGCRRAP
jgi:hypothetical protein